MSICALTTELTSGSNQPETARLAKEDIEWPKADLAGWSKTEYDKELWLVWTKKDSEYSKGLSLSSVQKDNDKEKRQQTFPWNSVQETCSKYIMTTQYNMFNVVLLA